MKHRELRVSDHAVIRYLERVRGIDVDAIRAEIADKAALAQEHEGCCGIVTDGFRYKIAGTVITTVIPASEADPNKGRS